MSLEQHQRVVIDDNAGNVVGAARAHARLVSAATTNATSVKTAAGALASLYALNTNAAVRYLKIYDKASAPTVGTDAPVLTMALPASSGTPLNLGDNGLALANGLAFALTANATDADATAIGAGDVILTLLYL